jgi:hypothetical protein
MASEQLSLEDLLGAKTEGQKPTPEKAKSKLDVSRKKVRKSKPSLKAQRGLLSEELLGKSLQTQQSLKAALSLRPNQVLLKLRAKNLSNWHQIRKMLLL